MEAKRMVHTLADDRFHLRRQNRFRRFHRLGLFGIVRCRSHQGRLGLSNGLGSLDFVIPVGSIRAQIRFFLLQPGNEFFVVFHKGLGNGIESRLNAAGVIPAGVEGHFAVAELLAAERERASVDAGLGDGHVGHRIRAGND